MQDIEVDKKWKMVSFSHSSHTSEEESNTLFQKVIPEKTKIARKYLGIKNFKDKKNEFEVSVSWFH